SGVLSSFHFPLIVPPLSLTGWIGFWHLAPRPAGGSLQRFDRPCLIDVDDCVELVGQPRAKIVAPPLGLRAVDHADRALQPRRAQHLSCDAIIAQQQQKVAPWIGGVVYGCRPRCTLRTGGKRAYCVEH